MRIVREALYYEPSGKGTNIPSALEYLSKVINRSSVAFVISDFYAKGYERSLSIARRRHDIIAISITDPVETDLPEIGILNLEDAETGRNFMLDSSSHAVRAKYRENALRLFGERQKILLSANIDHMDVHTDRPYASELYKFFRMRERRIRI